VDSQTFMSVTADVEVRDKVTLAPPWASFAPFMKKNYIRQLIQKIAFKPQVTLKSQTIEGAELRMHIEDRLGIAALVKDGEVQVAHPFIQVGREYEMEIVETSSSSSGLEGWVSARCLGKELTFYDVFYGFGTVSYEPGERRRFTLGAFAMSIKPVASISFHEHLDDGAFGVSTKRISGFVPKRDERPDLVIFQSTVESEPAQIQFKERAFESLPITLAEQDGERLGIDLVVASELTETLDSPLAAEEDIAGVLWLHGYCQQPLWPSS
jgi:hypothetical protein